MYSTDLAKQLPGPEWLKALRSEAAASAAATPLPTYEAEEWRYSPIEELRPEAFAPAVVAPAAATAPGADVGPTAASVVTVDGFVTELEVSAERLTVVSASNSDVPVGLDVGADVFGQSNVALAPDPIIVTVPAGVDIEHPVVITHHVLSDAVAVFPRVQVDVGADASVTVVEVFRSDDVSSLVVPVTRFSVADAARVSYQQVQELGASVWQLGVVDAEVGAQANFGGYFAGLGGGYARVRANCRLTGRGAHGDLFAFYFGDGDQTLDFRTFQDHVAPNTTSNLLFKGVVDDRSTSIYTGLITVRPDAAGTNAFQTNRTIKLSEDAWAESVPNLQIENNDVRCSHASTVSPVDPEQRFYLESRGVPTRVAERLIVEGFLAEVIGRLPVAAVNEHLLAAVAATLDARSAR